LLTPLPNSSLTVQEKVLPAQTRRRRKGRVRKEEAVAVAAAKDEDEKRRGSRKRKEGGVEGEMERRLQALQSFLRVAEENEVVKEKGEE
jgi:hypothetical protein